MIQKGLILRISGVLSEIATLLQVGTKESFDIVYNFISGSVCVPFEVRATRGVRVVIDPETKVKITAGKGQHPSITTHRPSERNARRYTPVKVDGLLSLSYTPPGLRAGSQRGGRREGEAQHSNDSHVRLSCHSGLPNG